MCSSDLFISSCAGCGFGYDGQGYCWDIVNKQYFTIIPTNYSNCPPFDFSLEAVCQTNSLTLMAGEQIIGGVPQFQFSTEYFLSELDALNNTSWTTKFWCSPGVRQYSVVPPATGTYWTSMKDGLGQVKAKSVTVSCYFPTPTPT